MSETLDKPLSARLQVFADGVLAGKAARTAWIDAGYSERSSSTEGPKALRNPRVAAYLAERRQAQAAKTDELSARVLKELEHMAFSNIEDLTRLDVDGNRYIDFSAATREQLAAVTSITNKSRTSYNAKGEKIATEKQSSFKVSDKYRGLELLGRHMGMFREAEQRVVIDVSDRLLNSRARLLRLTDQRANDTDDDQ